MDARRFDTWTRSRATSASRRSLLGWSVTAGLAAVLPRHQPSMAQFGGGGACTYAITLTSSLTAGQTASGTLVIEIGEEGAIDTGSLTLNGQAPATVVGQATGPAIALLASLADGTIVSLTGVANAPVGTCSTPIFGIMTNVEAAQLGTWQAQPESSGQSSAPADEAGQSTSTDTDDTTQAPAACDPPKMICGPTCCPAGADCFDTATGGCACPTGTEECDIACFPSCADGTPLDPVTCLCPTS